MRIHRSTKHSTRWAAMLIILIASVAISAAFAPLSRAQDGGNPPPPTFVPPGFPTPNAAGANGRGILRGWLNIAHGDPAPGSSEQYRILTSLVDAAGKRTDVQMDGGLAISLAGKHVVAEGTLVSNSGGGQSLQAESVALQDPEGDAPPVQSDVLTGAQPWVNVLCRFSDSTGTTPRPVSYFTDMMSNIYPRLDHFWRQVSYNQIDITGSTTAGWFNLPKTRSQYITLVGGQEVANLTLLRQDCLAAADASVFFPTYIGINMMFNQNLDCCAWGGQDSFTIDGQFKTYRITWNPPWAFNNITVLAHEMGHGFGYPHSGGASGTGYPYTSDWDVLSNAWSCDYSDATYGCVQQGTIAYHLNITGWIPADRWVTVASGTGAQVTLDRLVSPPTTTNDLAIQVPIAGSSQYYTVEARQRPANGTTAGNYEFSIPSNAVIIHRITPGNQEPARVVDSNSDSNNNVNDASAAWIVGETYTDTTNNISIAVLSTTGSSFTVRVLNNAPVPGGSTLVSPNGTITTANPTFRWNAGTNAQQYFLDVKNSGGTTIFSNWYVGTSVCTSGVCQATPTLNLTNANYSWTITTWGNEQTGPVSSAMNFTVNTNTLGGTTIIAPTGTINNATPTFQWNRVAAATWYLFSISNEVGGMLDVWYFGNDVCNATTCSATPALNLKNGFHTFWVTTWANNVFGPAASQQFRVAGQTPPTTTFISPATDVNIPPQIPEGDVVVTYVWDDVYGAESYYLQVTGPNGQSVGQWYDKYSVCSNRRCTVAPTPVYANDWHSAWVQTAGGGVTGGWSPVRTFRLVNQRPEVPTLISPLNWSNTSANPTFSWNASWQSSWYYLWIDGPNGNVLKQWFFGYTYCTPYPGQGTCAVTPTLNLPRGAYQWWIQTWGGDFFGHWSAVGQFNVP
jgi:M6 family metalloprotease-like protein